MPEKTARGGINACEPPFIAALENSGVFVRQEIYTFDHQSRRTKSFERVGNVLATAQKFGKTLRETDFDILHLNTAFDSKAVLRDAVTISLLKKRGAKIFLKMHGSDAALLQSSAHGFLWRRLFAKADGIGVLSNEERQNFIAAGVAENKIFTIKNAVRVPADFAPKTFAEKPFRLLFVSRFISTKGLFETVKAAAILRDKKVNFVLNCVGDGESKIAAELLVKDLNLKNFVQFSGFVPETTVDEFYRTSDLLIFPTFHQEGFPLVVFNALGHGLPIVTTKIRAAADYLCEPKNVLWTEPKNPEMLAEQIANLLANEKLLCEMSANNRKLSKDFTSEKIALEYLEIYRNIIGKI